MKGGYVHIYFLLGMMMLLQACGPGSVTPEEYIAYVDNPDNGLFRSENLGSFVIEVQYRPPAYEVIRETGTDMLTEEMLAEGLKTYAGTQSFLLRIGNNDKRVDALTANIADEEEYFSRINHLIASIHEDIWLVDGRDTLPCIMHHYERNYHLSGYHNVTLVFENRHAGQEESNSKIIIYDDSMLGTGKINLKIGKEAIDRIPGIIL